MKKLNVSVGVCAYNEEANISTALKAILSQKGKNFETGEVLVVLDGCTDKTREKVLALKNRKIKLIVHKERRGKTARLNEIFKKFKGQILVLADADIMLKSSDVFQKLVRPFPVDSRVGLICVKALPAKGRSWVEKSINTSVSSYLNYLEKVNQGNNIFGCKGLLMAVEGNFAKSLKIPARITANDAYVYFKAKKGGLKFRYVKDAKVYYRLPSSFADYALQNSRYSFASLEMSKQFGDLATGEYKINMRKMLFSMMGQFFRKPFWAISIILLSSYFRLFKRDEGKISPKWKVSLSTKGALNAN